MAGAIPADRIRGGCGFLCLHQKTASLRRHSNIASTRTVAIRFLESGVLIEQRNVADQIA